MREIIAHIPVSFCPSPSQPDKVVWLPSRTGSYSSKSAWETIRTHHQFQPWSKLVWFGQCVPRWSFILWLAIWERLATRDRPYEWGITADVHCVLCTNGTEFHGHLFLHCPMAMHVWIEVLMVNIYRAAVNIQEEIRWGLKFRRGKALEEGIYLSFLWPQLYIACGEKFQDL